MLLFFLYLFPIFLSLVHSVTALYYVYYVCIELHKQLFPGHDWVESLFNDYVARTLLLIVPAMTAFLSVGQFLYQTAYFLLTAPLILVVEDEGALDAFSLRGYYF